MIILPAIVKQSLDTDWFFSLCFWWKFSNHVHVSCRSPCIIQSGNLAMWLEASFYFYKQTILWNQLMRWRWGLVSVRQMRKINAFKCALPLCMLPFLVAEIFLGWFNFYLLGGCVAFRWLKEEAIQCMKEADWPLIFMIASIWQCHWLDGFILPMLLLWILKNSLVSPQWCKRKQVRIALTS